MQVIEDSVAEACGLKADDVIVEINNVSIVNLSHEMVHQLIVGFSDNFSVGVKRENEYEYVSTDPSRIERPGSENFSEISTTDSITGELEGPKVSEDHIAEIISGESEVLKDHNVIG